MTAKNFAETYFKCICKYLFAEWTEKERIIYEGFRIKDFSVHSPLEHCKENKWSCDYEIQCSYSRDMPHVPDKFFTYHFLHIHINQITVHIKQPHAKSFELL